MKITKWKLNNIPIKHKLVALLLCITIIPAIVLSLLIAVTVERVIEDQVTENTLQLIGQVNKSIEYYAGNMQNVSYLLSFDPEVETFLDGKRTEEGEYSIRQFMQRLTTLYPEVAGILAVNSKGEAVSNELYAPPDWDLTKENWYKQAVEGAGIFKMIGRPKNRSITSHVHYGEEEVVSVVRAIVDPDTKKVKGVILIDLKIRVIAEAARNINTGKAGYLMVLDEAGRPIYSPEPSLLKGVPVERFKVKKAGSFSSVINGEKRQFIYQNQPFTNWTTVGVFSTQESVREVRTINFFVVCFIFLIFFIAITAAYILSNSMVRPIERIISFIQKVDAGDLAVRYRDSRRDEIGMLGRSLNRMLIRIEKLMMMNKVQEQQKREAELRSLQAHIKPHFLYNTLDTINWMARKQKAYDVAEVVESLSTLFRIGLSKGHDIISLQDEITHIKSYLSIQKARYKDKLHYTIHMAPEVENASVLKLVLQPIVENAIYHGIKERRGPGHVHISACEENEQLLLTVEDDGAGMTEERLEQIRAKLASVQTEKTMQKTDFGYGMMNVQARIQLVFGSQYGIQIKSLRGAGTKVVVVLPLNYRLTGE
ncbi:sensor histidine kinase [Domibacillus sp. DTU_2020_1001157_1_SI_ALB_TIR_016]|uniref:sensor histidine kinase n=1 Tax=Domibacillus sp. DTU_2020_1001157_1_SI_ALB_TIR_016 TaxID=3077789 RepID=UPI0028E610CA|nr:sensor histidine kinase [Domibacillus sp. DTU_2020_1001157_1_SI_ALB_TIR_016]WNS80592.1 sensor histidine kinase [Domibacillus sp. DTU_2020_1001157_1_SI_ALB_TIR_016]